MFSIFADSLTIVLTILFPVFASYKALETGDPSQLCPWLTYWVVFSLASSAESVISFFYLDWLPFYAWARLGVHLYLLLPGETQGAGYIYNRYVKPFLVEHERSIEGFISDTHAQLKTAGIDYLHQGIEYVRYNVLGQQPPPPPPSSSAPQTYQNYAQSLLARFTAPASQSPTGVPRPPGSAHPGSSGGANDIYTLLSAAISTATSSSTTASSPRVAQNQRIIPASISDPSDRASYISATRERLKALLSAVDREESESHSHSHSERPRSSHPRRSDYREDDEGEDTETEDGLAYGSSEPSSSRRRRRHVSSGSHVSQRSERAASSDTRFRTSGSETDFERINHEDLGASSMGRVAAGTGSAAAGAGSWGTWVFGRKEAGSPGSGSGPGVGDDPDLSSATTARSVSESASYYSASSGADARRSTSGTTERHRSTRDRGDGERHHHSSRHRRDS